MAAHKEYTPPGPLTPERVLLRVMFVLLVLTPCTQFNTGAGTKSIEGFMAAHKEYSGTLKLGEGTPSLDAETAVEERLPWEHITGVLEHMTKASIAMTTHTTHRGWKKPFCGDNKYPDPSSSRFLGQGVTLSIHVCVCSV
jgi:hypothetical protein